MRAASRWARAHLRAHRAEAVLIVLATAGITVSLLLATSLFAYATDPWQRVFTRSTGAHVWIHTQAGAPAASLAGLDEVRAASGPFPTVRTTASLRLGGAKATLELRGAPRRPGVAAPQVVAGRWLDPARDAGGVSHRGGRPGIVLDSAVARAMWAKPGDSLALGGFAAPLRVVGVADTAEAGFPAGETPGVAWVLPGTLAASHAGPELRGRTIGLRLADPEDTDYVVQRAVTRLGADQITDVSTWRQAKAEAAGDNQLLGRLLGLFGLGALCATALAVGGAISTRVHGHLRDISVLKAVGCTPGQVVRMFLAVHLGFALLGGALGALLTQLLGPLAPGRIGEALALWQGLPEHTWLSAALPAGVVVFIGSATWLAAWRAGRVPPVPAGHAAVTSGHRSSGSTRRALGLRVPPALVLGWRAAFHRPLRASAAVARLAVPLLLITIALGAWSTLDRFTAHPASVGLPAALTARSDTLGDQQLRSLLAAQPRVTAYPGAEVEALVPGQTGTITLRGLGTGAHPYPFTVGEGRAAHGPDEAVAGQGLLDLLDAQVGDWVRMTVAGQPHVLHIVGRSIEPSDSGRVISTGLDTLRDGAPRLHPDFYNLVLHRGADPAAVRDALTNASAGRVEVREIPNPADQLSIVRAVIIGLIAVLVLIGLAELSATVAAAVRDRGRDLLALRAVGLTPRQIAAVIVAATVFITLTAALPGTALGACAAEWLINLQGHTSGWGTGIAQRPAMSTLLLINTIAVLAAATVSLPPAVRAVRRKLVDSADGFF
ncbi:ABC transporter permease [Streptomyces natalensis]|uniref:Peptide ABC transporter permease n=1 Tax=Streptomyces natalensis ATCC 27448 TaxID=1240678 RepID=A0A0D7CHD5_9ACTN|nr:ABC transporter permease [Streptomyces natalensis]KIZ15461.1 peptide ABC transporter permease [Streptomyces natalensis ATCC 27448]